MSIQNFMRVNGKTTLPGVDEITLNLADDSLEVRGFGQPISAAMAKKMAADYFHDSDEASKLVDQIEGNSNFSGLLGSSFDALKRILDPNKHIVSGVFGKELLLQILSQKNCEGIRYIFGKDGDRTTIILLGVRQVEGSTTVDVDGTSIAVSEPLGPTDFYKHVALGDPANPTDPPTGEVHKSSKTIAQVKKEIIGSIIPDPTDFLFGAF
jgi:hypothetical protein